MAFIATPESIAALGLTRVRPRGLSERHFWMMVGAAALVHLLVLLIINYWPREEVTEVTVRTLNVKLGDGQLWHKVEATEPEKPITPPPSQKPAPIAKVEAPVPASKPAAPASKEPAAREPEPLSFSSETLKQFPAPKAAPSPALPATRQRPALNPMQPQSSALTIPTQGQTHIKLDEVKLRRIQQQATMKNVPPLTASEPPSRPATATTVQAAPVKHVRATQLPPATAGYAEGSAEAKAIRARYEQELSLWLQKHRIYPAAAKMLGQHGQPQLRIRMDRGGNVKFHAIDTSSGYRLIDDAAMEMVKRANPFPPPPANYPGDKLLEFIVPVAFKLN